MDQTLNVGTINQIAENQVIYQENENVTSISLILKGSVVVYNAGFRMKLGPGNFIGITDLYLGKYAGTTEADSPCSLYVFDAKGIEDINRLVETNKDYKGYVVKSLNLYLAAMYDSYSVVKKTVNEVQSSIMDIIKEYQAITSTYEGTSSQNCSFPKILPYEKSLPVKEEWITVIKELVQVPNEVVATYYSYLPVAAKKEIEEKIKIATILMNQLLELSRYVTGLYDGLFHEHGDCVFKVLCNEVMQLAPSHASYKELTDLVDGVIELVNKMDHMNDTVFERETSVNRESMEKMYYGMLAANNDVYSEEEELTEEQIQYQLKNSLSQILEYGQIDTGMSERLKQLVEQFYELRDKGDISESVRALRKELTALFFFVYKQVFLQAYEQKQFPKAVELFLYFGYLDERLISQNQLIQLANLKLMRSVTHYCHCYTVYDWLVMIYEGEKEPSKNEMDQDFKDYIRSLRQEGKISEAEEKKYGNDVMMKLEFEINNFFLNNMKLTNGKISTFVPFLYQESMPERVEHFYVSPNRLDAVIRDILNVDFSVFYREVIYSNQRLGIPKELVMEEYLPDIILFPTSGTKGIMWQDIENKKRASSGRFCLPMIHEGSLMDTMIQVIGRYRWEVCRTVQGISWNDIRNKCLTSEYSDYLQFYRKNKELSEEKKEKVKQQLVKARNSTKECFVIDYENWIKYESKASIRLNKVVRDILAAHCPFSKDIRLQLVNRPVYNEALARYEKHVAARARVLEAKVLAISKKTSDVPKELLDTITYYSKK